jgi:IrrE N-terminal-like domain
MTQEHRFRRAEELSRARQEAHWVQKTHPAFFQEIAAPVEDLPHALGLVVQARSDSGRGERLEVLRHTESETATITVRHGHDGSVSRFAVAHEIGHAILLRKYPDTARRWGVGRREVFATAFATELLTSPETRDRMAASFRTLADPLALLKVASQMRLSPDALLTIAAQERSWIEGLDKVWLRVKYVANAVTHRHPKLRIVSAYYDTSRFYIPINQGLSRFAGDDGWLASFPVGAAVRHSSTLTLRVRQPAPAVPNFVTKEVPAVLSALRLQPSAADHADHLIILAEVAPNSY